MTISEKPDGDSEEAGEADAAYGSISILSMDDNAYLTPHTREYANSNVATGPWHENAHAQSQPDAPGEKTKLLIFESGREPNTRQAVEELGDHETEDTRTELLQTVQV